MTGSSEARERGVDFQHTLHALRCAGWTVAVHNDYRLSGEPKTFWLLTHPNGHYVKGEGATDMDALMQCDAAIHREVLLNDSAAKVTTPEANTHGQTGNVAAHVEQPLPGQHGGRSQKGEAKPTGSRPGTAELHDGSSDQPEGDGR